MYLLSYTGRPCSIDTRNIFKYFFPLHENEIIYIHWSKRCFNENNIMIHHCIYLS